MHFFRRHKTDHASDPSQLSREIMECKARCQFLVSVVAHLFNGIKAFVIDADELNPGNFKKCIDHLSEKFQNENNIKTLKKLFGKRKGEISSFSEAQARYLGEKENELKGMVNMLTKAVAEIHEDGMAFNDEIYQQSKRLEDIRRLDDLKKIKSAIGLEIKNVRNSLKEKQLKDKKRIEALSARCSMLDAELKSAAKNSLRDELTGVFSIKAFDRYMRNVEGSKDKKGVPFSLIILDIDNYDAIFKTYGKQIAHRVVLAIAKKCEGFVSSNQFVVRHKGGVFLIVMPETSLREASKRAKELRESIANSRYTVDDVHPEHIMVFTVSVGVSHYSGKGRVEETAKRALKAMFDAKESGGNRVVTEKARFLLFKKDDVETIDLIW